jgi:hypothetical protein
MAPVHSEAINTANAALAAAGLPTYDEAREALAVFLGLMIGSDEAEALRMHSLAVAAIKEAERITSA